MKKLSIFLIPVLILFTACTQQPGKYSSYSLTDEVTLLAENTYTPKSNNEVLSVRNHGFPYRLYDPNTKQPYNGTHTEIYENGRTSQWMIENGYMVRMESFYSDGQPAFLARFDKNEEIESRAWFKDGSLKMIFNKGSGDVYNQEGNVIASYEHSVETKYFENGNIKIVIPFNEENLYHGTVLVYNEEGSMKGELVYKDGKLVSQKEL